MAAKVSQTWQGMLLALCLWAPLAVSAAEVAPPVPLPQAIPPAGIQFWGDVQFFHEYHIQQNVFSGRYRLLDGQNRLHALGTLDDCRTALQTIRSARNLPPMSGRAIILLHGYGRSDRTLRDLRHYLEQRGHYVVAMNYPSIRCDLQGNAEYLRDVLQSLDGIEQIDLVGFSLGGLVVRAALAESSDQRIRRVVFIGSPQLGAELATQLCRYPAVNLIGGPVVRDMAQGTHGRAGELPLPRCEFGIIAGTCSTPEGFSPWIPGDDDGIVGVAATRLTGAADSMLVPYSHHQLLHREPVFNAAFHFLEHGRFSPDGLAVSPSLPLLPGRQATP